MWQNIYNLAKFLMMSLPEPMAHGNHNSEKNWKAVKELLKPLDSEALGKIACAKKNAEGEEFFLYSIHGGTWLGKYDNGQELLLDIATTVVFCAMAELQPDPERVELRKQRTA